MNDKKKVINYTFIGIVLVVLEFVFSNLSYHQATTTTMALYSSDLPIHIAQSLIEKPYSIIGLVLSFLVKLNYGFYLIAIFEGTLSVVTIIFSIIYLKKVFDISDTSALLIAVFALIYSKIYLPFFNADFFYCTGLDTGVLISYATQPWHNITYIGMKCMMPIVLLTYLSSVKEYNENHSIKRWLSMAISLAFSTAVKPNFLIFFSVGLLLLLIVDFVADFSKKRFFSCVWFGTTVLPSLLVLWIQSVILFDEQGGGESGIKFALSNSVLLTHGVKALLMLLFTCFAFPAFVFFFSKSKDSFKRVLPFTNLMFISAVFEMSFLREAGGREADMNFAWCTFGAAFVVALTYGGLFIKDLENKESKTWYKIVGMILFLAHFASSLWYFGNLFVGVAIV